jgi:hypothetical protein
MHPFRSLRNRRHEKEVFRKIQACHPVHPE